MHNKISAYLQGSSTHTHPLLKIRIEIPALMLRRFAAAFNVDTPRTWTELNYLRFALSSTAIGDVISLAVHDRALTSAEMFVGLMYLTAVMARLIGFSLQPRQ